MGCAGKRRRGRVHQMLLQHKTPSSGGKTPGQSGNRYVSLRHRGLMTQGREALIHFERPTEEQAAQFGALIMRIHGRDDSNSSATANVLPGASNVVDPPSISRPFQQASKTLC